MKTLSLMDGTSVAREPGQSPEEYHTTVIEMNLELREEFGIHQARYKEADGTLSYRFCGFIDGVRVWSEKTFGVVGLYQTLKALQTSATH